MSSVQKTSYYSNATEVNNMSTASLQAESAWAFRRQCGVMWRIWVLELRNQGLEFRFATDYLSVIG